MTSSEILPQLFVGSYPRNTQDVDSLRQECGITAVLNLQTNEDMEWLSTDWGALEAHYRASGVELLRVPVRDFDPEDLCARLPECVRALEGLLRAGHTVYLHCSAGAGRSPTVAIAYLHRCQGWDLEQAVAYVKRRRSCSPDVEAIRHAHWDEPERPEPTS